MISDLFEKLREHRLVLFVGAGFSIGAGMPSGKELAQVLRAKFFPHTQSDRLDEVASAIEYATEDHEKNRREMVSYIQEVLETRSAHSDAHELVASIPYFHTIITTNYDTLFEKAYHGKLSVIYNQQTLIDSDKSPEAVKLYKFHGDFADCGTIVLTQNDYALFLARQDRNLIFSRIKDLFATHTILFIGYSMADINVTAAWHWVNDTLDGCIAHHYFVAPGFTEIQQRQLKAKGIEYIDSYGEPILRELFEYCKKTMIPDMEDGHLSFEKVAEITKQNDGFVPLMQSSDVHKYLSGVQFMDEATGEVIVHMELHPENSARELFEKVSTGEIIDKIWLPADNIARIITSVNGYTLFGHDNIDLAVIKPLPDFEGAVCVYFDDEIIPLEAHAELYERKGGLRLIVRFDYMTVTLDIWPNQAKAFKMNFTYKPTKTVVERARLFSQLAKYFTHQKICVQIPGRRMPIMLAHGFVCEMDDYRTLRETIATFERFYRDLLELQRHFNIEFSQERGKNLTHETIQRAGVLAGLVTGKCILLADEYYTDVDVGEVCNRQSVLTERLFINALDSFNRYIELLEYRFVLTDVYIEPSKMKLVKREHRSSDTDRVWYRAQRGKLRLGCALKLDDGPVY